MSRSVRPWVLSQRGKITLQKGYRAHQRGDVATALRCYRRVLDENAYNPIALHYAALAGFQINQYARQEKKPAADDEVMRMMALSVAYAPDNAAAVHNFAKFKHDRGELGEARTLYLNALELNNQLAESWTNLGNVCGELGDRAAAEECWNRALACPASPAAEARFNISMLKLLRGEYDEGWADYECRWGCAGFRIGYGRPEIKGARWDGSPVDGTLLLHGEQGAGDVIMMARYIPLAQQLVTKVIVEVFPSLVEYVRATFPGVEVVEKGGEIPGHHVQLPMMSLPAVFRTSLATIPRPIPAKLDGIRPESGRIGVCWKGSPTHPNDRTRSVPFESVEQLLELPGVTWQSLQYGESPAPLQALEAADYLDTARAIARCELVITVDTSVAHLAGSLGVETWLLLPYVSEWRWLQDRTDSPWYPTMYLWRQAKAGDWGELLARVRGALTEILEVAA